MHDPPHLKTLHDKSLWLVDEKLIEWSQMLPLSRENHLDLIGENNQKE